MALLDQLGRKRGFTGTDEAIADFILAHLDEASEMGIAELALATHSSSAAIVRLCKKVGMGGYRDFRLRLMRELERTRNVIYDANPDQPFVEHSGTREIMTSIIQLSQQALEATYASVTTESVQEAARIIQESRNTALYAMSDTRISAIAFSNLLIKMGKVCTLSDQYGDLLVVSNFIGPQDAAIVISYSGSLINDMRKTLQVLTNRGCRVVLISTFEDVDELPSGISCSITLPKGETRGGRIATYYSQTCIRYALNCIYGEILSHSWEKNLAVRQSYAQLEEELL